MERTLDYKGRWRNHTVAFRVSDEEAKLLNDLVALSGLTKQDYITRRLLCRDVVVNILHHFVFDAVPGFTIRAFNYIGDPVGSGVIQTVQLRPGVFGTVQVALRIRHGDLGRVNGSAHILNYRVQVCFDPLSVR